METQTIKMSEIIAAAEARKLELDVPASFFLVYGHELSKLMSSSSIIPTTESQIAARWIVLAATALLKDCFKGLPQAWEALAFWKAVYEVQKEAAEQNSSLENLLADIDLPTKKGEQE